MSFPLERFLQCRNDDVPRSAPTASAQGLSAGLRCGTTELPSLSAFAAHCLFSLAPPRGDPGYFANNRIRRLNLGRGTHRPKRLAQLLTLSTGRPPTPISISTSAADYLSPIKASTTSSREHLIEHLSLEEGERLLSECCRCLMPGGVFAFATPDLGRLVEGYQTSSAAWQLYADEVLNRFFPKARTRTSAAAINNIMSNFGHRFVYDEPTLTRLLLENCAFCDVVRQPVGVSSYPSCAGSKFMAWRLARR